MNIKKSVDDLTTRPMDRRAFLISSGGAIIALLGVTSVLKSFGVETSSSSTKKAQGYGSSVYGD